MKKIVTLVTLALLSAITSRAEVVNFDDLNPADQTAIQIPDGYAGIDTWNNFYWITDTFYSGTGYNVGTVSSPISAYNGYGTPASMISGVDFSLLAGYFTSAWTDQWLTIVGKNNGVTLYSNSYWITTTSAQLINLDYIGVDEVNFSTSDSHFVMDNLTLNERAPSVPDSASTVVLMGAALTGVAVLRRRRA